MEDGDGPEKLVVAVTFMDDAAEPPSSTLSVADADGDVDIHIDSHSHSHSHIHGNHAHDVDDATDHETAAVRAWERTRKHGKMTSSKKKARCDSAPHEQRLSVCSTSGMVYEGVVVVGHMYGKDNIVYYLIEVRSWEMPLEGYVIRRRYNDFKKLHQTLARLMPSSKNRPGDMLGWYYSSLLCNPLPGAPPESSPLWSPPRSSEQGRSLRQPPSNSDSDGSTTGTENDTRYSAPAACSRHGMASGAGFAPKRSDAAMPLDRVKYDMNGRPLLPALPSGGVTSFFSTRHMLISYRIQQFNHILAAVMSDSSPEVAHALMNFIQENPGNQTNYVTLSQYAPLEMSWSVERRARRRAASMGKKPLRDVLTASAS